MLSGSLSAGDLTILSVAVAAVSLVVNVATRIWNGSWGLATKLQHMETRLSKAIATSTQELEDRADREIEATRDAFISIRNKITEVELYVRDNYVSRSEFKNHFDTQTGNLNSRLDRIEKMLDSRPH